MHLNIILQYKPRFSKRSLSFVFPYEYYLLCLCAYLILIDYIHSTSKYPLIRQPS